MVWVGGGGVDEVKMPRSIWIEEKGVGECRKRFVGFGLLYKRGRLVIYSMDREARTDSNFTIGDCKLGK